MEKQKRKKSSQKITVLKTETQKTAEELIKLYKQYIKVKPNIK